MVSDNEIAGVTYDEDAGVRVSDAGVTIARFNEVVGAAVIDDEAIGAGA